MTDLLTRTRDALADLQLRGHTIGLPDLLQDLLTALHLQQPTDDEATALAVVMAKELDWTWQGETMVTTDIVRTDTGARVAGAEHIIVPDPIECLQPIAAAVLEHGWVRTDHFAAEVRIRAEERERVARALDEYRVAGGAYGMQEKRPSNFGRAAAVVRSLK